MNELYAETSNSAQGNSLVLVQTLASQSASRQSIIKTFLVFQRADKQVLIIDKFASTLLIP